MQSAAVFALHLITSVLLEQVPPDDGRHIDVADRFQCKVAFHPTRTSTELNRLLLTRSPLKDENGNDVVRKRKVDLCGIRVSICQPKNGKNARAHSHTHTSPPLSVSFLFQPSPFFCLFPLCLSFFSTPFFPQSATMCVGPLRCQIMGR